MSPPLTLPPDPADRPFLRLVRSTGFKLAALHAVLIVVSAVALSAFFWWSTAGYLNRQTDLAVRTDVQLLTARWHAGGTEALAPAIEQKLAEDADDEEIYLLTDQVGRVLAGNIEQLSPSSLHEGDWHEGPILRDGQATVGRIYALDLPDGSRLLVGRDVKQRLELRELVGNAVLYGTLLALILAAIGGLLVRRLLQSRLAPVAATATAIGHGDLSHRVPLSGADDDFDHLAETVNAMLDRIGVLMDGVREVSNAIAHDLRTPLARLRGRLEEALEQTDAANLRAAVERGIAELDGIIGVFQALLRIAEIEAGARRSAFAGLDLAALLADAGDLYGAAADERGLVFVVDLPPSLPMVGDRDMLLQAAANLLDNAIKFTPPGGQVRLAAARRGGDIEITVSDSGPGIPAGDRGKVVERFYRAEASRGTPGSGLGLALVQAVAQLHGGTLAFEDAGPGLRATITLPAPEKPLEPEHAYVMAG
ncbi:sensor histidine kinase [Elioraea rosea]|uniref:sensor histidine kinase n=1 Tax=Elioraea rosea TaxID=2492390 RepID=UPI0011851FDB|nr:ATP-binding protein [Elioraea rosea]